MKQSYHEMGEVDSVTEDELREEDARLDAEEWQQREQDALDWQRMDRAQDQLNVQVLDIIAGIRQRDDAIGRIFAGDPTEVVA